MLNGQHSSRLDAKVGVHQGLIHGTLLLFVYINELLHGLNSNIKPFEDDRPLFSVVHNITDSATLFNSDLSKTNEWTLQWKMCFNLDPTKQAQEIIFNSSVRKAT